MVAVKIQSSEDIIRAYLQNLGFEGKALQNAVLLLAEKWEASGQKKEITTFLDELVAAQAQKLLGKHNLNNEQLAARFKFGFLLLDSSEKYKIFEDEAMVGIFDKVEAQKLFATAPEYNFSEMKAQKIETAEPNWLGKVFSLFKKD